MRHTIKAVLLSALVFPGTGHFSLKKPIQGSVLLGLTIICLYFLFSTALDISKDLNGKIQSGEMVFDKTEITELVTEKLSGGDHQFLGIAGMILFFCWVFGVIDSLRLGLLKDKNSNTNTSQKSF